MTKSKFAQQLEKLRNQHQTLTSIPVPTDKGKRNFPSLLFSPSEAAGYDERAIWILGKHGITELVTLDPIFAYWSSKFFSDEALENDRALMTISENEYLDKELRHFLLTLAPYMGTHVAAHRAIEWMIRKYRVHVLNVHDFLLSAIHVHDGSDLFVRMLQISDLRGPSARDSWAWLADVKREGREVSRQFLAMRCVVEGAFLEMLYEAVRWQVEQIEWSMRPTRAISFLTLVMMEYITVKSAPGRQKHSWNQNSILQLTRILHQAIHEASRYECPEWQLMAMTVLLYLNRYVDISSNGKEAIVKLLEEHAMMESELISQILPKFMTKWSAIKVLKK